MGIKSEFDEIKDNWPDSPLWVKVWLVLSAFLAVSSLASLAETIIKWKGFIKDAITVYKEWIASPLLELLANVNVHVLKGAVDLLVIQVVLVSSFIRFIWLSSEANKGRIKDTIFFTTVTFVAILNNIRLANNAARAPSFWEGLFSVLVICLIPLWVNYRKAWIFYLQVGAVVLSVGVLGAVNAGLKG